MTGGDGPVESWLERLSERHLANLELREVRKALQALSSLYVERRQGLSRGGPFSSAGKRAAYALFYGPLHLLLVRSIVRELGAAERPPRRIFDLGCGTGTAGAAWALEGGGRPRLEGLDRDRWAVAEARWTYRALGLRGRARVASLPLVRMPGRGEGVICAWTANELEPEAREVLLAAVLAAAEAGAAVLVVEPISRRAAPWWPIWAAAFEAEGGRADEWRFPTQRPPLVARLDKAAGLDHRELTGRSLWLSR